MRKRQFLIVFVALLAAPAASAQVGNAPFCLATDSTSTGGSRTAPIGPGRNAERASRAWDVTAI
jgi:hypothetical protein